MDDISNYNENSKLLIKLDEVKILEVDNTLDKNIIEKFSNDKNNLIRETMNIEREILGKKLLISNEENRNKKINGLENNDLNVNNVENSNE